MIWIFHLAVITILLLIYLYRENESFFVKSTFVYALFIFGQRWMTGTDFPWYLKWYLVNHQPNEPLYRILQNFVQSNNLYFGLLIFFVFLITLINNYRFFLKIDRNVVWIIYLYLISEIFFAQLSQLRQFVAISFFLNAYFQSYYGSKVKSLINILLGAAFHTSVLFLIPVLFVKIKLDRFKLLYLLLLSAILPLIDVTIFLRLPLFNRYAHYLGSRFDVGLSGFHYLKFYALLGILFIFAWYIESYGKNKVENMILNGIILNMLLYGLSFQFALMIRVSSYFKVFEFIFLAYYFKELAHFAKPVVKTLVLIFFIGIYTGLAITDPYDVTRYEFRALRIRDERTDTELRYEVDTFYDYYE